MNFAFTEDQLAFRDAVRDLLGNECDAAAVRAAWSADEPWSDDRWSRLVEMGVVGLTAPEALGGLGLGDVDLVLLLEESGRAALPEPLVETTAVAVPALVEAGGPDAEALVAALAAGEARAALALADDPWIAGAGQADVVLLQDGDALVVAEGGIGGAEPSVDRSRRLVARADVLAAPVRFGLEDRAEVLARAADRAAVGVAAQLIGLARQLIEVTVDYASERQQFGQPIGGFQAVKHHLADALLEVEFAAPAVYRAAWTIAEGLATAPRDASMAKAMAADAAGRAARTALQVHGAIGYTYEHDLHLWMKRVWALQPAFGDAAQHRRRVADAVL